jgi:hypothetical protein
MSVLKPNRKATFISPFFEYDFSDPHIIDWWDASTLSNGSVTGWTGSKSGYVLSQSNATYRPTKTSTGFNGRHAVEFNNAHCLTHSGSLSSLLQTDSFFTVVVAMQHKKATFQSIFAYTLVNPDSDSNSAGVYITNETTNGCSVYIRSTSGGTSGVRYSAASSFAISASFIASVNINKAAANGCNFIRTGSINLPLTTATQGNNVVQLANYPFILGARSQAGLHGLSGSIGAVAILHGSASNDTLRNVELALARKCGLTI